MSDASFKFLSHLPSLALHIPMAQSKKAKAARAAHARALETASNTISTPRLSLRLPARSARVITETLGSDSDESTGHDTHGSDSVMGGESLESAEILRNTTVVVVG